MAEVRLSDVIVPEVFNPYVLQQTKELSAFVQSGVVVESGLLNQFLFGGGITTNVPSLNDIPNDDAYISSDDPGVSSTPRKIGSSQEVAVRLSRNNSWSSMDLVAALAGTDPMMAIASRVAAYWVRQQQRCVLAILAGLIGDNIANDAGDYVRDISITTGTPTAANLFTASAFLEAMQTMGDAAEDLSAVAVHSVVYRRMQLLNLIDFIPNSRGEINIPTFLGRRVIVDDALVTATATPGLFVYHTYLFAAGAIQAGMGAPKVPTETDRLPAAGNGGGQEVLYSRVEWCYHPTGHAYIGAAAGGGPSNAILGAAASWNRVYPERKMIPVAVLRTNG